MPGWFPRLVVLFLLLPWKPLCVVAAYLAQPVVDWRSRKARERQEKGIAHVEQELDALLGNGQSPPTPRPPAETPGKNSLCLLSLPREPFRPNLPTMPLSREISGCAQNLSASLAIPPIIKDHVKSLPQGVFHSMDLEVEEIKFQGDSAEAYVKFQSPQVSELVIRQRYFLRRAGEQWQVESRQPTNGGSKPPTHSVPAAHPPMPHA